MPTDETRPAKNSNNPQPSESDSIYRKKAYAFSLLPSRHCESCKQGDCNARRRSVPLWRSRIRSRGRSNIYAHLPLHRLPDIGWFSLSNHRFRYQRISLSERRAKNIHKDRGKREPARARILSNMWHLRVFQARRRQTRILRIACGIATPALPAHAANTKLASLRSRLGRPSRRHPRDQWGLMNSLVRSGCPA